MRSSIINPHKKQKQQAKLDSVAENSKQVMQSHMMKPLINAHVHSKSGKGKVRKRVRGKTNAAVFHTVLSMAYIKLAGQSRWGRG